MWTVSIEKGTMTRVNGTLEDWLTVSQSRGEHLDCWPLTDWQATDQGFTETGSEVLSWPV